VPLEILKELFANLVAVHGQWSVVSG